MNDNLHQLKRDYDSSNTPLWSDPMTIKMLDKVVEDIKFMRLSYNDFRLFVNDNFEQGNFAWGCLQYVRGKI